MLQLTGHINGDGVLKMADRTMLEDWIKSHTNKDITFKIDVRKKRRSNPQNAYYHGVVVPMIQSGINQFGHDLSKEETHEFLKARFNRKEIELSEGYYIDAPGSTAGLSTVDFMEFIAKIQQFATEMLNIYIPDPGQQSLITL